MSAVSESSFFLEADEVLNDLIPKLSSSSLSSSSSDQQKKQQEEALNRIESIFDKYLECPSLLDSKLESIVSTLSKAASCIAHKIYNSQNNENEVLLTSLISNLSALYFIAKVRGSKQIQKFLTHNASDVEPILQMLSLVPFNEWKAIYSLLLWIGMLSLVPFDLNTIDSTKDISLITKMISTCQEHLSDTGPSRSIAATSLAKLLSRPDLESRELLGFLQFAQDIMQQYLNQECLIFQIMGVVQTLAAIFKSGKREFLLKLEGMNVLWEQAIRVANMAAPKDGNAGVLLLRKLLVKFFARVGCCYLPPKVAEWRYQRGRRSLLANLKEEEETGSNVIVSSSAGETTTTATISTSTSKEVVFHVPDQVEDSMAQLISSLDDPATTVRWSCAKGIGRVTERLPAICADDVLDAILELCLDFENDNAWHGACLALAELARRGLLLPDRLHQVVPIVVKAIQYDVPRGQHSVGAHVRDAACYTCWAFARAYAPDILKPFVPDLSKAIVLASLFDREINCRRAASAAFQESVGRQGADNFKHGIAILTAADYFTLGNRVEAFTNVAFFVASFEEYRQPIIECLYEDKLFHWDEEIRRLSAISLGTLTALDPDTFIMKVLPYLLQYCTHENIFVRHGALLGVAEILVAIKSEKIQEYSNATGLLVSISDLVNRIEKARLYRGRGGEIIRAAVSRFIECMALSEVPLTVKQQVAILDSVDSNLRHPKEEIQEAAAKALFAVTRSYFSVGEEGPSERLQKRIVEAYIQAVNTDENPAVTRGFTLALGHLPSKLLAPSRTVLDSVLNCLCKASNPTTLIGGQGDAETRRNAIGSLIMVSGTVGIGRSTTETDEYPSQAMNKDQLEKVFDALLVASEDYNTDRRGDVGSWSRIAVLNALEKLAYLSIRSSNLPQSYKDASETPPVPRVPSLRARCETLESNASEKVHACISQSKPFRGIEKQDEDVTVYFTSEMCSKIICVLLKQLSEKLDNIRNVAGGCLERLLLQENPRVPFVYSRPSLLEALRLNEKVQINWSNPEDTFALVLRAINVDEYFESILSGLVISVGGLTESVTRHSSKALFDYMRALKAMKQTGRISKNSHGKFRGPFAFAVLFLCLL